MSEPVYLSSSNVPHTEPDTISRLHGNQLRPFGLRAVGDLDDTLASTLLAMDPRNLILSQINMRGGTVRSQMSIVDGGDCEVLAKIPQ